MSKPVLPETIKWVITDFDGVVTDGSVYIHEDFTMTRKLNFKDIMGFFLLKKSGRHIAIISGEKNSAIETLSEKFGVDEVHQGIRIKIDVLKAIIEKYGLSQDDYLYMGDDVNDIECLEYAKYKVTVPNAADKVKCIENIQICENRGGDGAFREVADCLIG